MAFTTANGRTQTSLAEIKEMMTAKGLRLGMSLEGNERASHDHRVEAPQEVFVNQVEEDGETVIELEVAENDLGRVIGKQGRTARAFRNLLNTAGIKAHRRYALEILE